MTTLIWLAASSLIWGAILFCTVLALQSRCELSGSARQWMWRGAAMLLILPWIAAPFVDVIAPGLTLPVAVSEETSVLAPGEAAVYGIPTSMSADVAGLAPAVQERTGFSPPWIEILFVALIAGWLMRFGLARAAAARMRRLLGSSTPALEGAGREALETWSRRLALRRKPELRITAADVSPFSSGALRPVICLPDGIERKMRRQALGLVVGHECIHVARGDGWWRPAERAIADILWFNPFAWAIRRELDLARELSCDEAVVAASDERRAYARTLRDVAGLVAGMPRSAPAASMSLSGGSRLLAMRMRRTLAKAPGSGRLAILGAMLLALAAAPVAVAQALLIEAAQPQEAPPAPPAPPSIGAPAKAPLPPASPEAPENVQVSPDGAVRIGFPARVVETAGDAAQGYRLTLLQPLKNSAGETCSAKISGLSRLHVSKDQTLDKGAVIGERGNASAFSIAVACSDETDLRGWPRSVEAPPPAPLAPVSRPAPAPAVPVVVPAPPPPVVGVVPAAGAGETLHIWFPARVRVEDMAGDSLNYQVKLEQTQDTDEMSGCTVAVTGMTGLSVTNGQVVASGAAIGTLGEDPTLSLACLSMKVGSARPSAIVLSPRPPAARPPRAGASSGRPRAVRLQVTPDREALIQSLTTPPKLDGAPKAVLETNARKTSGFGFTTPPNKSEAKLHEGIDLAAQLGTPVQAPGAAMVTFAGDRGGYGNLVELDAGAGHTMRFAHLGEIHVKAGDRVESGQTIGTIGDDEFSSGPHLHFEYRFQGRPYDPEKVEGLILTQPG